MKPRAKKTVKVTQKKEVVALPELIHELRVPTADMYAYMNIQFRGTADEAFTEHQRLMSMVKGGAGLERKDFIKVLDEYLSTKQLSGDPGIIEQMSPDQQLVISEIRRSFTRIK